MEIIDIREQAVSIPNNINFSPFLEIYVKPHQLKKISVKDPFGY